MGYLAVNPWYWLVVGLKRLKRRVRREEVRVREGWWGPGFYCLVNLWENPVYWLVKMVYWLVVYLKRAFQLEELWVMEGEGEPGLYYMD